MTRLSKTILCITLAISVFWGATLTAGAAAASTTVGVPLLPVNRVLTVDIKSDGKGYLTAGQMLTEKPVADSKGYIYFSTAHEFIAPAGKYVLEYRLVRTASQDRRTIDTIKAFQGTVEGSYGIISIQQKWRLPVEEWSNFDVEVWAGQDKADVLVNVLSLAGSGKRPLLTQGLFDALQQSEVDLSYSGGKLLSEFPKGKNQFTTLTQVRFLQPGSYELKVSMFGPDGKLIKASSPKTFSPTIPESSGSLVVNWNGDLSQVGPYHLVAEVKSAAGVYSYSSYFSVYEPKQ